MSVDTFVILSDERLPSVAEWQRALDQAGVDIRLDDVDDLRQHSGYLPARFNGADSGFEWSYGIVDEVFGERPDGAGGRGHAIDLVTHDDEQEAMCALYAAGVLARLTDGLFYDEDAGDFVPGDRAMEIAAEWARSEQERKQRLAAADAALTDRRCPECGAPCPSYRKTCKACGYAVGRLD